MITITIQSEDLSAYKAATEKWYRERLIYIVKKITAETYVDTGRLSQVIQDAEKAFDSANPRPQILPRL